MFESDPGMEVKMRLMIFLLIASLPFAFSLAKEKDDKVISIGAIIKKLNSKDEGEINDALVEVKKRGKELIRVLPKIETLLLEEARPEKKSSKKKEKRTNNNFDYIARNHPEFVKINKEKKIELLIDALTSITENKSVETLQRIHDQIDEKEDKYKVKETIKEAIDKLDKKDGGKNDQNAE
jgi:hypothetical protein